MSETKCFWNGARFAGNLSTAMDFITSVASRPYPLPDEEPFWRENMAISALNAASAALKDTCIPLDQQKKVDKLLSEAIADIKIDPIIAFNDMNKAMLEIWKERK